MEYEGEVRVGGYINVNKLGMAVVDNQQSSSMIGTANTRTENTSKIDGSFKGASGNIGANVAAGDSNVQGNSASWPPMTRSMPSSSWVVVNNNMAPWRIVGCRGLPPRAPATTGRPITAIRTRPVWAMGPSRMPQATSGSM